MTVTTILDEKFIQTAIIIIIIIKTELSMK